MRSVSKTFRLISCSAAFGLIGCGKYFYNAPSQLPPYIHKLAVRPFTNHTQQYGLEDQLTTAIQNEFNRDGRYEITTEQLADGVVIGDITKYILDPISYDVNHVPTEYKLWVLVDVSFHDKVKNESLWKEPSMAGELRYYVSTSGFPGSLTEEDARQTIWDQLSRDIRTRTYQGATADPSDKSGGKTSSDAYNSGPPVDNTPPPIPDTQPPAPSPTRLPY